jgi:GTP cyclohydrolase II
LGFGADMRDYSICAPMLEHLGAKAVKLMTNNPRKVKALKELGINVVDRVQIQADSNPHNAQYLSTKAGKLGHLLKEEK